MRKRVLGYLQLSLQGIGIASLGTMNVFEPRPEVLLLGGTSLILGLIIACIYKG